MNQLVIHDIEDSLLQDLQARASSHGHSVEEEARCILREAAQRNSHDAWAQADAIRNSLAASGRVFSDSAELIREDRER